MLCIRKTFLESIGIKSLAPDYPFVSRWVQVADPSPQAGDGPRAKRTGVRDSKKQFIGQFFSEQPNELPHKLQKSYDRL